MKNKEIKHPKNQPEQNPEQEKQKNSFEIKINFEGKTENYIFSDDLTIEEIIKICIEKFLGKIYNPFELKNYVLKVNGRECFPRKKISYYNEEINDNIIFYLKYKNNNGIESKRNDYCDDYEDEDEDEDEIDLEKLDLNPKNIVQESYEEKNNFEMEINIKFLGVGEKKFFGNNNIELNGILKLCLLKEIACTNDFKKMNNLPEKISNIMSILQKGEIDYNNVQDGILKVLEKIKGGNIINFSRYIDEVISQEEINTFLISKLNDSKNRINYIQNCLGKYKEYVELLEKEMERAKRNSVFEFSTIAIIIIEREDIDKFEQNRQNCDNRIDRVLFHGTSHDSISKILPDLFKRGTRFQHGKGIYFTEDIDSCWIYGSEEKNKNVNNNRRNKDIPKIGAFLTFIASAIYYDKTGYRRVYDSKYTPKKNEINFALAGMNKLETIEEEIPDQTKFYGTEFVVNHFEQICPFMSLKLKRDEYCIIWRDNNFSSKPIYNNKFDEIFKNFLKERIKYINQMSKFNIYPCETSEEALKLIKRKKYNKIILMSNIGTDLGGKKFVEEAREIIGNNVVVLFNAYNIRHLKWVKDFPNALFSNVPKFYEQYLSCFYTNSEEECKESILNLKENIEGHFNVKFNFNDKFLDYPNTKNPKIKEFKDLTF